MSGPVSMLVVAKAPVPGQVKTRLAATVGPERAARVAAAALLDTLDACEAAVGAGHCHLALAGDLSAAASGPTIGRRLQRWRVVPQHGTGLGARLARAHAAVPGPVVQIGMDTPQVTPGALREVAAALGEYDAVLGPAEDGGWWALGLRDPAHAAVLDDVPMSTHETCTATRAALADGGLRVGTCATLRDVDREADADAVAAVAPGGRFAAEWAGYR